MKLRNQIIEKLATSISQNISQHPLRVAVDGRTASGKTTLANELNSHIIDMGHTTIRTSIDGFHRPRVERYKQGRQSPRGYYEDARDLSAVRQLLLDPLAPEGNRRFRTASFDLEADMPMNQASKLAGPNDVLIVDGTFLQRAELLDAWDYIVFVDVDEHTAVERGAQRDTPSFSNYATAFATHKERYQSAFQIYLNECDPYASATAIFNNEDFSKPALRFVT